MRTSRGFLLIDLKLGLDRHTQCILDLPFYSVRYISDCRKWGQVRICEELRLRNLIFDETRRKGIILLHYAGGDGKFMEIVICQDEAELATISAKLKTFIHKP